MSGTRARGAPRSTSSFCIGILAALALAAAGPLPSRAAPAAPGAGVDGSPVLAGAGHGLARPGPGSGRRASAAQGPRDVAREEFWAFDFATESYYSLAANLVHTSDVLDIYVESGRTVSLPAIAKLAVLFEDQIYPKLRNRMGHEPEPGVDGDRAIAVLLLDIRDSYGRDLPPHTVVAGYFDPTNEYLQAQLDANPNSAGRRSNEREMIYLDVNPGDPNGVAFRQTLAHEFQHLITWNYDPDEAEWLNEGLSELAVNIAGLGHPVEHVDAFVRDPEGSLVAFDGTPRDYGKVYLFMLYLLEQAARSEAAGFAAAADWPKPLVQDGAHGLDSLAARLPVERPLAGAFRDYATAAALDDPTLSDGRYGFDTLDLGLPADGLRAFRSLLAHTHASYPIEGQPARLAPWSLRLERFVAGRGDVDIVLAGDRPWCGATVGLPRFSRAPAGSADVRARCTAGEPPALGWTFEDFRTGGTTAAILAVAANASDAPLDLVLSALQPVGSLRWSRPVQLPIAVR
jgi:hypothetical protein